MSSLTIPAVPLTRSSASDDDSSFSERAARRYRQEVQEEVEVSSVVEGGSSIEIDYASQCCVNSFAFEAIENHVKEDTKSEKLANLELSIISRSSFEPPFDDDDDDASQSSAYFEQMDFDTSTWLNVVYDNMDYAPSATLALVATASVIVHPLLFLAGAATAMWAVGSVHAIQHGYDFFTDGSFSRLFWNEPPEAVTYDERLAIAREEAKRLDKDIGQVNSISSFEKASTETTVATDSEGEEESVDLQKDVGLSVRMEDFDPNASSHTEWMNFHFPSLDVPIVQNVEFPGLNAIEFFQVFFADDAPYCFREFQKQRGDVDIVFRPWTDISPVSMSIHPEATNPPCNLAGDHVSCQERVLTFKTLTKSYFGPAYATATKTQRVFKSKRLMILESRTHLSNIPFCDRFQVMDRWILVSQKCDERVEGKVATLSVLSQVQFRRSCLFEDQIRTKSTTKLHEIVTSWCEMATQALKLAERKKLEREQHQASSFAEDKKILHTNTESEEKLLARHASNFRRMDQQIADGSNLESIEVRHSYAAGRSLSFAQIVGDVREDPVVHVDRTRNRVRSFSNIRRSVVQRLTRKGSLQ